MFASFYKHFGMMALDSQAFNFVQVHPVPRKAFWRFLPLDGYQHVGVIRSGRCSAEVNIHQN